jgi:hypothetical protein
VVPTIAAESCVTRDILPDEDAFLYGEKDIPYHPKFYGDIDDSQHDHPKPMIDAVSPASQSKDVLQHPLLARSTDKPTDVVPPVVVVAQQTMRYIGPNAGDVIWMSYLPVSYVKLLRTSTVSASYTFGQHYNHTHSIPAFERKVMAAVLENYYAESFIVPYDIGSRWWTAPERWLTNNPCVCATDVMHIADTMQEPTCKCMWPNCDHCNHVHSLCFIHSIYYLKESDVAGYLSHHVAQDIFVVAHDFSKSVPGMQITHIPQQGHCVNEGRVSCQIGGTQYTHSDVEWLKHPSDYHLAIQLVASLPYTNLFRIMYNPNAIAPTPIITQSDCDEDLLRDFVRGHFIGKIFCEESLRTGMQAARTFVRVEKLDISAAVIERIVSKAYHDPLRREFFKQVRPRLYEHMAMSMAKLKWWDCRHIVCRTLCWFMVFAMTVFGCVALVNFTMALFPQAIGAYALGDHCPHLQDENHGGGWVNMAIDHLQYLHRSYAGTLGRITELGRELWQTDLFYIRLFISYINVCLLHFLGPVYALLINVVPHANAAGDFGAYHPYLQDVVYGDGWARVPSINMDASHLQYLHRNYADTIIPVAYNMRRMDMVSKNQYQFLYGIGVQERPFSIAQSAYGDVVTYHERILYPAIMAQHHFEQSFSILAVLEETVQTFDLDIISLDEWIERFPLNKRRRISKTLGRRCLADWIKNMFTKRELISKDVIKAARAITMSSDSANAILGPNIVSIGNWLKKVWDVHNVITYASGMTASDAGEWMSICLDDGYCHFYEDDFWNYDGTIHTDWLKLEHDVYCHLLGDELFQAALQNQLGGTAYTYFGHKFTWKGGRKSGDPNTSLGNSLINATVHYRLVPGHKRLLVMGDDIVVATKERLTTEQISQVNIGLLASGFKSEFKASDPYRLSFCSRWFWTTGSRWFLGPKIGRFVSRCGWTVRRQDDFANWFGANLHGFYGVLDFPILRQYRDWFAASSSRAFDDDYYRFHEDRVYGWNHSLADQFEYIYGTDPNAWFIPTRPRLGTTLALSVEPLMACE